MSMKTLFAIWTACIVVGTLGPGCDSDSSSSAPAAAATAAVVVEFAGPDKDVAVEAGSPVRIDYMDTDVTDDATTSLYADQDEDLSTIDDQIVIALDRPAHLGTYQTVLWRTSDVPPGVYAIIAEITDWTTGRSMFTVAQGLITILPRRPSDVHLDVVLKDRWGGPVSEDSSEPYSPRKTCGRCHDVDHIANGYHFQQGRTDHREQIVMKTDFFADGRDWLKSAGMYGKW